MNNNKIPMLGEFPPGGVRLLDPYELNAFSLEIKYLKSLDPERLLKSFREIAGIESPYERYGGWEDSDIRGHTLGHYLTAVYQAYCSTGDGELRGIIMRLLRGLAECQSDSGYLAAIPEGHFAQLERGEPEGTWVPWYNLHKLLSALVCAGAQFPEAAEIASKLGDWVWSRTSVWSDEVQKNVLNVEYGGMNDCLYQLYALTGSEKHLAAAHAFDELPLFDELFAGHDILDGRHANTTIPKIIGALRRYMVLGAGEEYYLKTAGNFWKMVVGSHTYVTGGNSEWEHFGEPKVLDAERTNCNCETCNIHNMLRLTRELFRITGEKKYAEFYERAFINTILSSQNPETGMTTYFQPMATGYFKVYSTPTEHFWCCTGTGMENFSKLNDSIYFHDESSVFVLRFTSSELRWAEKNLLLTQKCGLPDKPRVSFGINAIDSEKEIEAAGIIIRIPEWCAGEPTVTVSGAAADISDGFIRISGIHAGSSVNITFEPKISVDRLPDNRNSAAFCWGPYVLSADLGSRSMETGVTGVNVTVPTADPEVSEVITVTDGSVEEWFENVGENIVKADGKPEFRLKNTDRDIVFTPHFMQYEKRYGIYFLFTDGGVKK